MNDSNHRFILALGCNINQENAMRSALIMLEEKFGTLNKSQCLWTEPIGLDSDKFLNCLVYGYTTMSPPALSVFLKDIERQCGRRQEDKAEGIIRMDIDILQYDNQRLHEDDWKRDYIRILYDELSRHTRLSLP